MLRCYWKIILPYIFNISIGHLSNTQEHFILLLRLFMPLYSLYVVLSLYHTHTHTHTPPLLTLCQNTHTRHIFRILPTFSSYNTPSTSSFTSSISVCTFFLFSGGERWCEHNRVCISIQLWVGERQEDCHRFGNRYPVWLRPLLLVGHTHTHLFPNLSTRIQTQVSL